MFHSESDSAREKSSASRSSTPEEVRCGSVWTQTLDIDSGGGEEQKEEPRPVLFVVRVADDRSSSPARFHLQN